jgi:hypothetical protein
MVDHNGRCVMSDGITCRTVCHVRRYMMSNAPIRRIPAKISSVKSWTYDASEHLIHMPGAPRPQKSRKTPEMIWPLKWQTVGNASLNPKNGRSRTRTDSLFLNGPAIGFRGTLGHPGLDRRVVPSARLGPLFRHLLVVAEFSDRTLRVHMRCDFD